MSYRLLAPVYDWVALRVSRYRSPALLTAKVLELAPDGCELLDVGVGTGLSIAPYMGSHRFKRIVGVDPSGAMLDRCRGKHPHVELHHGTLDAVRSTLPVPFDIVQSCGAVEHVADLDRFVADVAALLKPGGWFVFTYEPELLFTLRQSRTAPHIGTYGRARVYRRAPHEIARVLVNAGLTVREDIEFKAYLGLVHHLVVAGGA
jgi:predicted TPR repeat methyltransferase